MWLLSYPLPTLQCNSARDDWFMCKRYSGKRWSTSQRCMIPSKSSLNKQQILDSSKLKEFAEDNFKFVLNMRKLFKQEKDTAAKEEIARYE